MEHPQFTINWVDLDASRNIVVQIKHKSTENTWLLNLPVTSDISTILSNFYKEKIQEIRDNNLGNIFNEN